jgi:hypothetical protein
LQGRLDSLTFVEVDETQKIVQTNDEKSIVIQPRAFNLGHQDVSHAMSSHNAVGEWIQMRQALPQKLVLLPPPTDARWATRLLLFCHLPVS